MCARAGFEMSSVLASHGDEVMRMALNKVCLSGASLITGGHTIRPKVPSTLITVDASALVILHKPYTDYRYFVPPRTSGGTSPLG
jgi:hypothetical protein